MKKLILMSFLLLALMCWQTSAVEKTKVNLVKSELPGGTVQQSGTELGTVGTVGTGDLLVENVLPPNSDAGINETIEANNDTGDNPTTPVNNKGFWELLGGYWAELVLGIMAVLKILVRVTPTLKDDKVFGWIDTLLEMLIPNITSKKNG